MVLANPTNLSCSNAPYPFVTSGNLKQKYASTHFFARKVSNISDHARRSRMLSFSSFVYTGCGSGKN